MPDSTAFPSSCASRLAASAACLRALTGWRRARTAFGFGLLAALAFPPVNFTPFLWVSFPVLITLLQGTSGARQAFVTGWSFAFGMFLLGLYWIAAAMFVDLDHFWWAVPLAVAGLPAVFAVYYGLAAVAARKLDLRGFSGAMGFALIWFLADYARGNLFTGFPWNLEGYAWSGVLPILQVTSMTGIYGLTLLTLITACLPVLLAEYTSRNRAIVGGGFMLLAFCATWGEWRLMHAPVANVPDVRLRIVQPNIDQAHKWLAEERELNFERLMELSSTPAVKPVTHIVWPETASPFYLTEDTAHRRDMATRLPSRALLLTGVVRRTNDEGGQMHFYNSLIAVDSQARVTAGYDKHHLVPFGEYIPFRSILPLRPLVALGVDFSGGDGPRSLHVEGLPPFSPLVCYEAIFPDEVTAKDDPPQFLLNVTNDGWYGQTSGPWQHFAIARVRSIEEGMPLVRAANTGISGMVDAYGRITARLNLGTAGYVDADLPKSISTTFFSRRGETPMWFLFTVLALWVISTPKAKKK